MFHRVHNQRHRHYKFKLRAIIHDEFDNSIAHHFACPSETQHEYIKVCSFLYNIPRVGCIKNSFVNLLLIL